MRTKEQLERDLKEGFFTFGWSRERLVYHIRYNITYEEYKLLGSGDSEDKAENLLGKWGKEEKTKGKIIGYSLVKKEFEKQALEISGCTGCGWHSREGIDLSESSRGVQRLKDAGVLDLWFEPVYEDYKIGDIVVVNDDNYTNRVCRVREESIHNPLPATRSGLLTVDIPHNIMGGYNVGKSKLRFATTEESMEYTRPKLPEINGYEGKDLDDESIKYGCALIPKVWFKVTNEKPSHGNRDIAKLTLTNGVEFTEGHVKQIKEYLGYKMVEEHRSKG